MKNSNNLDLKLLTKESITGALLFLMETKEYSKISITDICNRAGVSRNAFYRNYPAKDAILRRYLYEVTDIWRRELRNIPRLTTQQYFTILFEQSAKQKELVKKMIAAGIEYLLIDVFFTFFRNFTLNARKPFYWQCHFAGSIYAIFIHWIMNNQPETAEELGLMVCKFNHFPPDLRLKLPPPIDIDELMNISTFTYRD